MLHLNRLDSLISSREKYWSPNEIKRFPSYVEKYHQNVIPQRYCLHPKQIMVSEIPTLKDLQFFLQHIKPIYLQARGNHNEFITTLKKIDNGIYYLLFNLLIGTEVPSVQFITFSYWDRLMVHLILAWCVYLNHQIKLSGLFQLIDVINHDQFWKPPIRHY